MHTSAKEHTVSNPSQQPAPPVPIPAQKRKRWPWIVLGAIVVLIVVIVSVSGNGGPAPAAQPAAAAAPAAAGAPAPTGEAAILGAAGPLHAHVENSNQLICDAGTATAAVAGGGFSVLVNYPGPANVAVSVMSLDQQTADQHVTVGGQEPGHAFKFSEFPLKQAEVISVTVTSAAGVGTCDVVNHLG